MEENNYNVTTRNHAGEMHPSGISYIVIPSDVDRSKYINECFATNTVSIFSEHNGYSSHVPIDKNSLNFIVFPKTVKDFGSPVSFKCDPIHQVPFIDAIYFGTDEISELVENQFKFKRKFNNNVVEIVGSPEGKYVGINVIADVEGEVFINVRSKDKSAKFTVNVDGDSVINSGGNLMVRQFDKFTSVTADPDNKDQFTVHEQTSTDHTFYSDNHEINADNVTVRSDNILTEGKKVNFKKVEEFKINDGKEPYILGKKWAKFMKDFIKEVGSSTTSTAIGQMPLLNAEQITAYQDKVDELLSEIVFIDK